MINLKKVNAFNNEYSYLYSKLDDTQRDNMVKLKKS